MADTDTKVGSAPVEVKAESVKTDAPQVEQAPEAAAGRKAAKKAKAPAVRSTRPKVKPLIADEAKRVKDSEQAFAEASLMAVAPLAPAKKPAMPAVEKAAAKPAPKAPVTAKAEAEKPVEQPVAAIAADIAVDLEKDAELVFSLAGKSFEDLTHGLDGLATLQQGVLSAIVDSALASAQNIEALGDNLLDHAEKMQAERLQFVTACLGVRQPVDILRLQEEYAKACYEHLVYGCSATAETVTRLSQDAFDPLSAEFSRMIDRLWSRAA